MSDSVQWTPDCSVGVPEMDAQHQRWFAIVNDVSRALSGPEPDLPALDRALQEALDYTNTHFEAEEALMRQIGYPGLEAHRAQHRDFVKLLERFAGPEATHAPGPALGKLLRRWLRGHILSEDKRYAAFIAEQGSREPEGAAP